MPHKVTRASVCDAQYLLNEMFAEHESIPVENIIALAKERRVRFGALVVAKKNLGLVTSDHLRWVWSRQ